MALVRRDSSPELEVGHTIFGILRAGLPPQALEAAVQSEVPLYLVPLTSDLVGPPNRTDMEQHAPLLTEFMETFQSRAPIQSDVVKGHDSSQRFV